MLSSPPDAAKEGLPVAAAFAIVTSLTAELVAVKRANSFPLVSKIEVPIFGEVKVLFVNVSVDEAVINPVSSMSGLTPSLAVA
jgi:predicted outer membrane lipoprotein